MKRNCRLQTKYITESISSVVTVTITEHLTVFISLNYLVRLHHLFHVALSRHIFAPSHDFPPYYKVEINHVIINVSLTIFN